MTSTRQTALALGKPRFGMFDFGLDQQAEERARRLHNESTIIDALFWGPITHLAFPPTLLQRLIASRNNRPPGWLTTLDSRAFAIREAAYGRFPEFRQIWDATGITAGQYELPIGSNELLLQYAAHLDLVFDHMPWIKRARRAADIREAKRSGDHAFFLHCQPAEPISRNLRLIEQAYDIGLRCLQLTYNNHDLVGAGCTDRSGAGLSDFGVTVIKLLNELGILVDTSHASMRTVLDACEVSQRPVIASHTSARDLYFHDRGSSDEAIRAIAATGGTIGVVTLPPYLRSGEDVDMNSVLDHIDYIAQLVGPEHVAIGTDWPLGEPAVGVDEFIRDSLYSHGFRPEHNISTANVIGFDDYRDFPNFTRGLVARGYTDDEIRGILGENFLRVFEQVCG